MKPNYYQALSNATTPAARLATWQRIPSPGRLREIRAAKYRGDTMAARRASLIKAQGPELSTPDAEHPLLWTEPDAREVSRTWAARKWESHNGWFQMDDGVGGDTYEGYAVELVRFPGVLFEAVLDSCNGDLRVALDCPREVDFDYNPNYPEDCREDTARQVCRAADSTAERDAEESREYYRKDRAEQDIADNKAELATLRHAIRGLAHELRDACAGMLPEAYPATAAAARKALRAMLHERQDLYKRNRELAASI